MLCVRCNPIFCVHSTPTAALVTSRLHDLHTSEYWHTTRPWRSIQASDVTARNLRRHCADGDGCVRGYGPECLNNTISTTKQFTPLGFLPLQLRRSPNRVVSVNQHKLHVWDDLSSKLKDTGVVALTEHGWKQTSARGFLNVLKRRRIDWLLSDWLWSNCTNFSRWLKIVPIGDWGHLLTLTWPRMTLKVISSWMFHRPLTSYQVSLRSDEVDFLAKFEVTWLND